MTANPVPNNTNYPIIKGIPLPKVKSKYPFESMEVGDSFEILGYSVKLARRMTAAAARFTAKKDFKTWKFRFILIVKRGNRILLAQRTA